MSIRGIVQVTALVCIAAAVKGQDSEPVQPRVVDPGNSSKPPSDAIVLFDGTDLQAWITRDGAPARCQATDVEMVCKSGDGDVVTSQTFGDAQIHVEFKVPHMPNETGQARGNSGVYVHGAWEV